MISSGPSGFHNAPITKVTIATVITLSIGSQVFRFRSYLLLSLMSLITKFQFWRLFTSHLLFDSLSEALPGFVLLYIFRIHERQMGSRKFVAFIIAVLTFTTLGSIAFMVLFTNYLRYTTPGPYGIIFASFILYYKDVPPMIRLKVCGVKMSDKNLVYLLGVQLLFSDFPKSILAGGLGLAAGMLYRSDLLGIHRRLAAPDWLSSFFNRFVSPIVDSDPVSAAGLGQSRQFGGGQSGRRRREGQGFTDTLLPDDGDDESGEAYFPQISAPFNVAHAGVPVSPPTTDMSPEIPEPTEETIDSLTAMGFGRDQAIRALRQANNDVERATNILLDS